VGRFVGQERKGPSQLLLAQERQRTRGETVIGFAAGDDRPAPRCRARRFDRDLGGLGAAVGKCRATKIGVCERGQTLSQKARFEWRIEIQHRRPVRFQRGAQGRHQPRVVVADVVDAEAREEVGVVATGVVGELCSGGLHKPPAEIKRFEEFDKIRIDVAFPQVMGPIASHERAPEKVAQPVRPFRLGI